MLKLLTPQPCNHSINLCRSSLNARNCRTGDLPAGTASSGTQTLCSVAPTSTPAACGWISGSLFAGRTSFTALADVENGLVFIGFDQCVAGLDLACASRPLGLVVCT